MFYRKTQADTELVYMHVQRRDRHCLWLQIPFILNKTLEHTHKSHALELLEFRV